MFWYFAGDMGVPHSCTGIDLYLEASQYYETFENLLADYAHEISFTCVEADHVTPTHNPNKSVKNNRYDLSGVFGPGLTIERGSLLVDEKDNKSERVKLIAFSDKANEEDHRIFAIQVMNMSNFTHPNVILLHGVVFQSE